MKASIENLPFSIPRVAWTGGDTPAKWRDTHKRERSLVRSDFRTNARAMIDFWGNFGGLDNARLVWGRARHDAHASIRAALRSGLQITRD